jgi:hypothetical protein
MGQRQVVAPIELGSDLVKSLRAVNEQIATIEDVAQVQGVDKHLLRDERGSFVLAPMLAAQAQLLYALVLHNQPRK